MAYGFDAQVGADGTHRGSDELTVFGEHLDCFRVCVCVCVCVCEIRPGVHSSPQPLTKPSLKRPPAGRTGASRGFPGGSDGEESACTTGDLAPTPGSGRSSGEGDGCSLQYSHLENHMDMGWLGGYSPWGHRVSHD